MLFHSSNSIYFPSISDQCLVCNSDRNHLIKLFEFYSTQFSQDCMEIGAEIQRLEQQNLELSQVLKPQLELQLNDG